MANTRLQRTFSQAATSTKKGTFSFWMKRASLSGEQDILASPYGSGRSFIRIESNGQIYATINNAVDTHMPNMLFRDLSNWYHIVLAIDLTQSTSTDRVKFYVNGNLITSYGSQTPASSSETISWGQNGKITDIGYDTTDGGSGYFDGSLSHVHWIDGTAYDASYFGETDATTGEWKINTSPSVTYGTNGFFILKDGNSVTDSSPNSNNFTVGGGTLTKTEDSPSNVFATMNPLANFYPGSTFAYGNTQTSMPASNKSFNVSTIGMPSTSGKFYAEVKILVPSQYTEIGISSGASTASIGGLGRTTSTSGNYEWGYTNGNQVVRHNGGAMSWSGVNYTTNDIVAVALDNDNQKIYWSVNGVYQNSGVPTSGATGTGALSTSTVPSFYHFAGGDNHSSGDPTNTILQWNFGNGYFGTTAVSSAGTNASGIGIFEFNVPTGYTALSTKGLNL